MKKSFVLAVALSLASLQAPAQDAAAAFKVIVNPAVGGTKIPKATLAQIYLGKAKSWGDGSAIAPVDLSTVSPVRKAFSEAVLNLPIDGVKQYWMRNVASGMRPPAVKDSDAAVIAFVGSTRGAVGYVSGAAELPATVRQVAVE